MADVIDFGNDILMFGPPAMMETIFGYVQQHAADDRELMHLVSREDEFDAMGGWDLFDLSLAALKRLNEVVMKLQDDLPGAIDDWNEPFRPKFYHYFEQFKQKLAERISALEQASR
jgi:hypothetical protein